MDNEQPVFRNDDKFQRLPFRDWLRKRMPNGRAGYVVEDLDLVPRVYGPNYNEDDIGKFMLLELKYTSSWIGVAQQKTFGLIHRVCRAGDPARRRYLGYYVINYDNEDWDQATICINRQPVTMDQFREFMQLKDIGIKSLFDDVDKTL